MLIHFLSTLSFYGTIIGILLAFFSALYSFKNKSLRAFIVTCIGTFIALASFFSGHFADKKLALIQAEKYETDKDLLKNVFNLQIDSLNKTLSKVDSLSLLKIDSVNFELEKAKQSQKQNEDFFKKELERAHDRLSKSKNPIVQRSLSPKQRRKFVNILKTNKGIIEISSLLGDREARIFAHELKDIIESAGWNTGDSISDIVYHRKPLPGIIVLINSLEHSPSFAATLRQAFEAIGLIVDVKASKNLSKNKVQLTIGYKRLNSE